MSNETKLIESIVKAAAKVGVALEPSEIVIERSKDPIHGDYATNAAMKFCKKAAKRPLDFANELVANIDDPSIEKIEIAGPGFINFFMKTASLSEVISKVMEEGATYGQGEPKGKRINVEFVSANPTGNLHLGHTRGAALGDSVANLLKKAGYDVTKEYYVNDCGNQVEHLGKSIRARYHELFGEPLELGEDDYHGVDLIEIAKEIKDRFGDKYLVDTDESHDYFIRYGIDRELGKIKKDMADFGVVFDRFSYESDIRKSGVIEKTIEEFKAKGFTYMADDGTFLRTTDYGDDKDRAIIKKDGKYTYFMPDICYHYDKMKRGYDILIDMLGADHHGYIPRMKAALQIGGYDKDALEMDIYQIVKVYRDGKEEKMSKRTGKGITHRDLVEEVGKDSVRYFFAEKSGNLHLDFDYNLATSKSSDNPVYYAQYAHARCASLLELGKDIPLVMNGEGLSSEKEADILKQLADFPSMIESAASLRAPSKVAGYIQKLSQSIHGYYASSKIINREDMTLSGERLALIKAAMIVLENALAILGVSAPDKM